MKAKMEVKSFALKHLEYGDFYRAFDGWTFRDFKNDPRSLNDWVAFTTVMYCPMDGLVHCGLTHFSSDVLHVFDPSMEEFRSLGYQRIAEQYEVKIHRSLVMHDDGYIYGATALFHDINEANRAPGGRVFRYRPGGKDDIDLLGRPIPHTYIQSLALDRDSRRWQDVPRCGRPGLVLHFQLSQR